MAVTSFFRSIPLGSRRKDPFIFKTFFELGLEESASPFLTPLSKNIAKNIELKISFTAALFLVVAYLFRHVALHDLFLSAVYVIAGGPLLINSLNDVIHKKEVNIDVLMTLAAFSAYFLEGGFEGALLIVLFSLSEALEIAVTLRAKRALASVHELAPTKAYVIDPEYHIKELAVQDVPIKSRVLVRSGELIPLDGIVVEGESELSLQHITGEAHPVYKVKGDEVFSGARVLEGALTIEVTKTSSDSTAARIIALITKAEQSKPRLESIFDVFGRYYALSIILISVLSVFVLYYGLHVPLWGTGGAVYRALSFLIGASPCALILAVPIAYISAIGACARRGVVLKGGIVLDALMTTQAVAFDKTGTLTTGDLSLSKIEIVSGKELYTELELMSIAAALERHAVHPIAKSFSAMKGLETFAVEEVSVIPGSGVHGVILFRGKKLQASIGRPESKKSVGSVAVLHLPDAQVLFSFEDTIRDKSRETIQELYLRDKQVFMLTGDTEESAERVAKILGLKEWRANLRPEDKLDTISLLSKQFGLVMCGDGANDAPALERATVGISMGKVGSGTAREASDCVLLEDSIEHIPFLFDKAKMTRRIVRQNIALALVAICCASIPALYGIVPLYLAVLLHEGGTVLVGLNAIRLLK